MPQQLPAEFQPAPAPLPPDPDLPDYLADGFAPAAATVTQLVRILARHGVPLPPSRQRKDVYVALFADLILPHRARLLRLKARPSPRQPPRGVFASPAANAAGTLPMSPLAATPSKATKRAALRPNTPIPADANAADVAVDAAAPPPPLPLPADVAGVFSDENPFQSPAKRAHTITTARTPRSTAHGRNQDKHPHSEDDEFAVAASIESSAATTDENAAESPPALSPNSGRRSAKPRPKRPHGQGLAARTPLRQHSQQPAVVADPAPTASVNLDFGIAEPPAYVRPHHASATEDDDATNPLLVSPPSARHGARTPSSFGAAGVRNRHHLNHADPLGAPSPRTLSEIMKAMRERMADSPEHLYVRQQQTPAARAPDGLDNDDHDDHDDEHDEDHQQTKQIQHQPKTSRRPSAHASARSSMPARAFDWRLAASTLLALALSRQARLAALALAMALGVLAVHWQVAIHPDLTFCPSSDTDAHAEAPRAYSGWNPLGRATPACIACPDHAVCTPRAVEACADGHVASRGLIARLVHNQPASWASAVFPLGEPTCVQDTARLEKEARKQQRVAALIAVLDDIVRTWVGRAECGDVHPTAESKWAWSAHGSRPRRVLGMPLSLARESLRKRVPKHWTAPIFEEHWQAVLDRVATGVVQTDDDSNAISTVLDDSTHQHRLLVSSAAPIHSISCRVRRHVWRLALDYAPYLICSSAAVVLGMLTYAAHVQRAAERRVVAAIVEDVLDMVHSESDNHQVDPARYPAPGLPLAQLRDHLLSKTVSQSRALFSDPAKNGHPTRAHGMDDVPYPTHTDPNGHTIWSIPDAQTRDRLWKLVMAEISKTSMVRKTTMEVRGQPQDLWMWVASYALSPRKPRSTVRSDATSLIHVQRDASSGSGTRLSDRVSRERHEPDGFRMNPVPLKPAVF